MAEEKSSTSLENDAFCCVLSVLRMLLEELVRKQVTI